MMKIMFVCHGNICRSPMAEAIFNSIIQKNKCGNKFLVDSSATSYEEIGNPIYPPAKKVLKENGIPFKEHFSKKLNSDMYEKFDLFIVMDENNLKNIKRIFPNDRDAKIKKLLDFTDMCGDVADPYFSGDFKKTYADILNGCTGLYNYLSGENNG